MKDFPCTLSTFDAKSGYHHSLNKGDENVKQSHTKKLTAYLAGLAILAGSAVVWHLRLCGGEPDG